MSLDEIVAAQKRGEAKGITSVCSAHPFVIKQTLKVCKTFGVSPLIEATCNQVNQFGGYTGMKPADFVAFVRGIAGQIDAEQRFQAYKDELKAHNLRFDEKLVVDGVNRDRIVRSLTLEGDLSPEQRARLVEIASRCPTARILAQPVMLECRLAD